MFQPVRCVRSRTRLLAAVAVGLTALVAVPAGASESLPATTLGATKVSAERQARRVVNFAMATVAVVLGGGVIAIRRLEQIH